MADGRRSGVLVPLASLSNSMVFGRNLQPVVSGHVADILYLQERKSAKDLQGGDNESHLVNC